VVEEAPSPIVTPDLRKKMGEAAVRLARAGGYVNAGTVEFLVDQNLNFYFLEVNTRLQVEHPVTEMVTGLDLVKLQIRVAAGEPLPFSQGGVALSGHAVECRLYAEDPNNQFFPSPGKILSRRAPSGPGIRFDDGVSEGFTVSTEYDPMLGKLIAWGQDRAEAIARLERALEEHEISGIKTNAGLLLSILRDPQFQRGEIFTRWLDDRLTQLLANQQSQEQDSVAEDAAIVAAVLYFAGTKSAAPANGAAAAADSRWKREARFEQVDRSE
jgi:acetyl-CoA carboxylase biotin carboxylase subunit